MSNAIIVSRHQATIKWLMSEKWVAPTTPVISHATRRDIHDKIVIGNLPYNLAKFARNVWVVEFNCPPHLRGVDIDYEEFLTLNPTINRYAVVDLGPNPPEMSKETLYLHTC